MSPLELLGRVESASVRFIIVAFGNRASFSSRISFSVILWRIADAGNRFSFVRSTT
jgi:hypothetical protein